MFNLQKFTFSEFAENTYVIWDSSSFIGSVIDPGMNNQNENEIFDEFIKKNKIRLDSIINTHCHIDHIFGVKHVLENYNVKYFAPEGDLELFDLASVHAGMFMIDMDIPEKPKLFIKDEEFSIGEIKGKYLYTPGHTAGEVCLYFADENVCITGDVLFKEGIGRTDLPGGDYDLLINSIQKELLSLPDATKIYPGHGDSSTINYEKQHNPFLK